jgi:sec-independent protein translocase protein TatA
MPFGPEVLIVLGVVVLMFGGSKLPGLARSLGSAKQEFESASKGKAADTGAVVPPVAVATAPGTVTIVTETETETETQPARDAA